MSYDIWLEFDSGGAARVRYGDWNYTSNCLPIWRLAGADLAEFEGKSAGECLPILEVAIQELEKNPEKYRPLEPENGLGGLDTLIPALRRLAGIFAEAPKGIVRVFR